MDTMTVKELTKDMTRIKKGLKKGEMKKLKTTGTALDSQGEHWKAECPKCGIELEFKGWFDPLDLCRCDCGCEFYVNKIWLNDKEYIQ